MVINCLTSLMHQSEVEVTGSFYGLSRIQEIISLNIEMKVLLINKKTNSWLSNGVTYWLSDFFRSAGNIMPRN